MSVNTQRNMRSQVFHGPAQHNLGVPRRRVTQVIWLGIMMLMVSILSACGSGLPSESDARQVFLNQQGDYFKPFIHSGLAVVDFRKVNGQRRSGFGVEEYSIEYEAIIRWPKGANLKCLHELRADNIPDESSILAASDDCDGKVIAKVGAVDKRHDTITFELTEKGWKGPDGNIY